MPTDSREEDMLSPPETGRDERNRSTSAGTFIAAIACRKHPLRPCAWGCCEAIGDFSRLTPNAKRYFVHHNVLRRQHRARNARGAQTPTRSMLHHHFDRPVEAGAPRAYFSSEDLSSEDFLTISLLSTQPPLW